MQTMQTALLVGPYDWDEALVPKAEFDRRIKAALDAAAARGLAGLVVHGSSEDNGALAWLTGFTPKLGSGFALLAPGKPIRIIVPGAAAMLETARRMTWAEDLHALRDPAKQIADWRDEIAGERANGATLGLAGTQTMAGQLYGRVTSGLKVADADALVDTLRRSKSPVEQKLIRKAAEILATATAALAKAQSAGKGARSAALAAKEAAFHAGAQDARFLASLHDGGAPLPLDGTTDPKCEPLLAHLAVRYAGYWAEGFVTLGRPTPARERAEAALAAALDAAKPGATGAEIAAAAAAGNLALYRRHPSAGPAIGSGIGLALAEGPDFAAEPSARIEENGAYSLRVGAAGDGADNALASALILVTEGKAETLWPAR